MDATAAVVGAEEVGPDTVAISFESPEGFDARPGQFVKLTGTVDGEEVSRFYTLSSPDADGEFEVTVAVDPDEAEDGAFSEYLAGLSGGDRVEVAGPFGTHYYEGEARAVLVAAGPGIGPAVAIGERALREGREVAVVYRTDADAPAHADRLAALRDGGATVAVTDGPVETAVAEAVTGAPGERAFVYGFAGFVEEATAALEAAGVDPDEAKVESFG